MSINNFPQVPLPQPLPASALSVPIAPLPQTVVPPATTAGLPNQSLNSLMNLLMTMLQTTQQMSTSSPAPAFLAATPTPPAAAIKFDGADMEQYMNTVNPTGQSVGASDQGRVAGYMVEFYAGSRLKNSPKEQQAILDQINQDINSTNPNEKNAAMLAAVASHYKFSQAEDGQYGAYDNAKIKEYIQTLPPSAERDSILENFDENNDISSIGSLVRLVRLGQAPDAMKKLLDPASGLVLDQDLYKQSIDHIKRSDLTLIRANGANDEEGGGGGGGRGGGGANNDTTVGVAKSSVISDIRTGNTPPAVTTPAAASPPPTLLAANPTQSTTDILQKVIQMLMAFLKT